MPPHARPRHTQPSGPSATASVATVLKALKARWAALRPREQLLLGAGAAVLALALVWLLALAPALGVLRSAPAQIDRLQSQQQLMAQMARDAAVLREQTHAGPDDARAALAETTRNVLGSRAQLTGTGDQAQVRLEQVLPAELLDWLAQVRSNARLAPTETDLTLNPQGQWSGSATFALPPPG
ncbi:MAG: type II secretion system protein GspM [Comamonas sp.]